MAQLGMSVKEFMRAAGVSRSTAYKLIWEGKIPAVRLGRRLIIPRQAVDKIFNEAANKKPL